jgi:hypothetical protein
MVASPPQSPKPNLFGAFFQRFKRTAHGSSLAKTYDSGPGSNRNRYFACDFLAEKGIASVIWFQDLLALHGSDTQVFDLHLLVHDPAEAAAFFTQAGYSRISVDWTFEDDPEFSERGIRLSSPDSKTVVFLLPCQDWYYDLDDSVENYLPALHTFLDSMIEFWLNISSRDYVDRLRFALWVACLIGYCYALTDSDGSPVKEALYAKRLKMEHREVHYHIVSKEQTEEFTTTNRHQYHMRRYREIKEGTFIPSPYKKGVHKASLNAILEQ